MAVPVNHVHDGLPQAANDGYLTLRQLAAYSGLSARSLQRYVTALHRPIPHYRPGGPHGKILVRRSAFDHWLAQWHYPDGRALALAKLQTGRASRPFPHLPGSAGARAARPDAHHAA
jgi:hypothetical protein